MPLSEDEQRILQDIERSFYETDPKFAETVSRTTLYRHAGRNCKWAVALFVAGLVVLLSSFVKAPLIAFLGFAAMTAGAVVFVTNVRRIGNARMRDLAEASAANPMADRVEGVRRRFIDRFRPGPD